MADKQAILHNHARELMDLEAQIQTHLRDDLGIFRDSPEIHDVLLSAIQGAGERRQALNQYLGAFHHADGSGGEVQVTSANPASTSSVLKRHLATFGYAIAAYTVLTELAFRLYDPPLRDLAPKHLKAHTSLVYSVTRLLPAVVSEELAATHELFCQCVCPMCGLGACACVTVGRQHIETAWRDAAGIAVAAAGFPLPGPRPDSPLAAEGVKRGDVLLAVDGQEARTIPDIQAAIRKHAIGDAVHLRIGRPNEDPRDITVLHTSDNPPK
jgi:PDZ domain-containing protein